MAAIRRTGRSRHSSATPRADVLDPGALGVAGAGADDDQVDALGEHRLADLVERPQPAQAPVLGRALGADPADHVVGADVRRLELGDEVGGELARADHRDPGAQAVAEPRP